jgi:hypothetical protein
MSIERGDRYVRPMRTASNLPRIAIVVLAISIAIVIAAITVMVPIGAAGPSTALAASSGSGRIVDGVPEAVVVVTRDGTISSWSGTPRGAARWVCGYFALAAPVTNVLDPTPIVDWDGGPVVPVAGEWYMFGCTDGSGARVRTSWTAYDPGDPFHGTIDVPRAVEEARARLPIPDPVPVVNPFDTQLVGLPMWMWLAEPWERIWAEASIGNAWAGVAAWPSTAHWQFADGSDAWCDRGIPYDIWRPVADQWSNCTHVFTHSSSTREGGIEWVRVTVFWDVEWLSSDSGGEPLGSVTRSVEFPVRVVEAQALVQ